MIASFFHRLTRLLGVSSPDSTPAASGADSPHSGTVISCAEALARVQEYLDGELDHVSHEEVAHHFSICKGCFPHLRLEERFREALHRSRGSEVCPEHLRQQVLRLLTGEGGEPG